MKGLQLFRGFVALLEIVIVITADAANDTIELRLVDGRYPNQGRVEVRSTGDDTWGTYCSNDNPHSTGRVACRQLGFPALYSASATAQFGTGTGPIWFQAVYCKNARVKGVSSLENCLSLAWSPRYDNCDHRFDVGLTCFTGNMRLVGGQRENEGVVEVHVGGDDWVLLSYNDQLNFMYSDYICLHLGYQFSVGATEEKVYDTNQEMLCVYGRCPIDKSKRSFFSCIDDRVVKLCPDHANTNLLGVVCATENEVIPTDASLEFRLDLTANSSQHRGIIEARYNGTSWLTVCIQTLTDVAKPFADDVCKMLGYPWAYTVKEILYSQSTGYLSTGDEFIMRELFTESNNGHVRWTRGQDACQTHDYKLVFVECETGVLLYGLMVWPCPTQTCRGRCGRPATNKLCGCDAVCSQCTDCCLDYNERCAVDLEVSEIAASFTGSFSCKRVNSDRAIIVDGCPQEWNDLQVAQQCGNVSLSGLVQYVDGMFFQNLYCAQCNGLNVSDLRYNKYAWAADYDVGLDDCSMSTPEILSGCRSYSAIFRTPDGTKYKNPHCGYCNLVNLTAWDYCPFKIRPPIFIAHLEILLGRKVDPWTPEISTGLLMEGEINCFNKLYQLHVLPVDRGNSSEGSLSLNPEPITEITRCFLVTLGWQNIQLTWPFYISFIEHDMFSLLMNGSFEVTTQYISNVTDFKVMLDKTVLPPHEEGSSRDWVGRCGVGQVDFVEICDTTVNGTQQQCVDSEYATKAEHLRAFYMSDVQIIYVGDGKLVEAKSVSFVRTYHYQPQHINSSDEDTIVLVCGERFESAECRLPLVEETESMSTADGEPALKYKGKLFRKDQVVYLPDDRILICSSIFLNSVEPYISFSDPLTILNTIGYSLSIAALFATFSNYCVFHVLRNVPGGAIMSLTSALFSAQLLTLTVLDKAENHAFCIAMAVLMHFLWLSTFTWMNALAFDLMRTFASKQVSRPSKKIFINYCLYGWGVPLLIVASCLIIHFNNGQSIGFQYGGEQSCWVVGEYAVVGAFTIPMACSLVANAVLFGWTVRNVHASLVAAAMVHAGKAKSKEVRRELGIYFKISCVMGFTWFFGCLGNFIDHQVIWYLFVILNSLQGVFIFVSFGCNIRIRDLWTQKLGIKKRQKAKKNQNNFSLSTAVAGSTSARGTGTTVTP